MVANLKKVYKKRGFDPATVTATLTLITGVAVAVLVLIFTASLGGQTYQQVESDLNTIGDDTAYTVTSTFVVNNASFTSFGRANAKTVVFTNSTGFVLPASNYTTSLVNGTVKLNSGSVYNGTTWRASGTYDNTTIQEYVKDGVISGFKAQKQTGNYLPLIVLAAVIGLVLSMVLGLGGFRGGGGMNAL